MNIFSNIGITELIFILLLALLVVGPERLPEVARTLAKTLRDVRKAYDNLTRDLGPELMSIQESTREIRESVESVRSIPKDTLNSVMKAADLDDTVGELRDVEDRIRQVGKTMSDAQKMVRQPLKTTADVARAALTGTGAAAAGVHAAETTGDEGSPDAELVEHARPVQVDLPLQQAAQEIARIVTEEIEPVAPERGGDPEKGGGAQRQEEQADE
jgi:Tat protein translocase TatB subunit